MPNHFIDWWPIQGSIPVSLAAVHPIYRCCCCCCCCCFCFYCSLLLAYYYYYWCRCYCFILPLPLPFYYFFILTPCCPIFFCQNCNSRHFLSVSALAFTLSGLRGLTVKLLSSSPSLPYGHLCLPSLHIDYGLAYD